MNNIIIIVLAIKLIFFEVLKEVVPQWQSKLVHTVNEEPQFNTLRDKLIEMMLAIDIHMKNTPIKDFENILANQIHIDSTVSRWTSNKI